MHLVLVSVAPLLALLVVAAVLGTDALGRSLTDEEKKRLGALLVEHDYPGVRFIALRFALKLTRNKHRAQDLMGRADLRLVRSGWDPSKVDLGRALCRLVWSEWTHASSETEASRKAEEGFLRELEATEGLTLARATPPKDSESGERREPREWVVPSYEENVAALAAERAQATKASVKLAQLKVMFEKAGDEVNLLWLERQLEGERFVDARTLASETGRPVEDFYAATKRRNRHVQRLLANDRGVDSVEEEPRSDVSP